MTLQEKNIIVRFATGEDTLKDYAIYFHRKYLSEKSYQKSIYRRFMNEVDNPVPNLALKSIYRKKLLKKYEKERHQNKT